MSNDQRRALRPCWKCKHMRVSGKAWKKRRVRCAKGRSHCYVNMNDGMDFYEPAEEKAPHDD